MATCPRHHIELAVEKQSLELYGNKYESTIGTCPKCTTKYINRKIFQSGTEIVIGGTRYEFLDALSKEFPFDLGAELLKRAEEKELERIAEAERLAQILAKEKRKKQQEQRKRQAEKQRQAQELREREKRRQTEKLFKQYSEQPNKPYHPVFVEECAEIPDVCPHDQTKILYLTHLLHRKSREGYCCVHCCRIFVLAKPKNPANKNNKPKPKTGGATKTKSSQKSNANQIYGTWTLNSPIPQEELPCSTILTASIGRQENNTIFEEFITIVADAKDQDTCNKIFWIGREFAATIMAAIQSPLSPKMEFLHSGRKHWVNSYQSYPQTPKYIDIIARFSNPIEPQTVYVFAHKHIEHFDSDDYETVTAMIPCRNTQYPVPVTVYFDKQSHRYYLNETTYDSVRSKFGLPYLKLRDASRHLPFTGLASLKAKSLLFKLGYSVSVASGNTLREPTQPLVSHYRRSNYDKKRSDDPHRVANPYAKRHGPHG